jgi:hypothetical protein
MSQLRGIASLKMLFCFDERSDPTGGATSDSVGDPKPFSGGPPIPGYLDYPSVGEVRCSES